MKGLRSRSMTAIALGLLAGSTIGVSAQEEEAEVSPPAEVSGHIDCGPEVRSGSSDPEVYPLAEGPLIIERTHGYAWQPSATMSDPRLEGTYYISYDDDAYTYPGATFDRLGTGTWRIENEEGAWQGSYTNAGLTDGTMTTATSVLIGEGAYAGLSVFWETSGDWNACTWDVRGLIIEGEVPAAPQPFIDE